MIKNEYIFFKKQFAFEYISIGNSTAPALTLINNQEREEYVLKKVHKFKDFNHFNNKENILSLIDEVNQMCDYDIKTASIDTNAIDHIYGLANSISRKEIIYAYNYSHILGSIVFMIFDLPNIKLDHIIKGNPHPFSTDHMFCLTYLELLNCKKQYNLQCQLPDGSKSPIVAYGATLSLASLIENQLKLHTRIHYTKQFINQIESKTSSGLISLTEIEKHLINYQKYSREMTDIYSDSTTFDAYSSSHNQFYKLITTHKLIDENDADIKGIFKMKDLTLNQLIQSKYFSDIADPRFVTAMNYVFGRNKLNLRNQLAHCEVKYFNYYNISITSLLYFLFLVISEEIFLQE